MQVLQEERRVLRVCDCEVRGGRAVRLAAPDGHAAGDSGYVCADGLFISDCAEGVLPGAGYRRAAGNYGGSTDDQLQRDESRQQALARLILQDKDVESVSSFIGIDGTNSTLNSGRIQINLKDRISGARRLWR